MFPILRKISENSKIVSIKLKDLQFNWENDYQFVFQKNEFSDRLKEVINQNVQINLSTDKKDPKFQDLGKMEESSIVYLAGNNSSELSLIHYNMKKMSRTEKQLEISKNDKNFPISGYRSLCDVENNLVYLFGGKTDGNYTTQRTSQLKQVKKDEGKFIDIEKLESMKFSRAYHGAAMVNYNKQKYLLAIGGQQTQKAAAMPSFGKDSDSESVCSSVFEMNVPRYCISECEIFDIKNNKWIEIPELTSKRSNTSVWQLEGSSVVFWFGGWNGKNSVNSIEKLDLKEYLENKTSSETSIELGEETKSDSSLKIQKSRSTQSEKKISLTWISVVVREAGVLTSAPNYRLFAAWNSIGCIALDENWILLFGGKENIKDGEMDQCYMFYGNNRVKSINPNDHL